MNLLLDSHVVLWWLGDHPLLGTSAADSIRSADLVYVSVVTPWELGIKRAAGKLEVTVELVAELKSVGFTMLPVSAEHAERAPIQPLHHRDPFDRMLVAQAQIDSLTLVTANDVLGKYDCELLDARQ